MLKAVERAVSAIARVMAVIAGLALILIALIVMAEVVMRAMGTPLIGGIEMIRIVFVVSVFFAFAYVITLDREIRVDVLRQFFPGRGGRVLDALASLITVAFFGFFLWFSVPRLNDAWTRGVYLEGRLLIPMWIPWATIVLGSVLSVLAALLAAIKHLAGPRTDGAGAADSSGEQHHHSSV